MSLALFSLFVILVMNVCKWLLVPATFFQVFSHLSYRFSIFVTLLFAVVASHSQLAGDSETSFEDFITVFIILIKSYISASLKDIDVFGNLTFRL